MPSSICVTDTTFIKNNLSKEENGTNYRNRRAANSVRQWWLTNKNNKRKQKIKLRTPIWNIGWTLKGFWEEGKLSGDINRVIILDFSLWMAQSVRRPCFSRLRKCTQILHIWKRKCLEIYNLQLCMTQGDNNFFFNSLLLVPCNPL